MLEIDDALSQFYFGIKSPLTRDRYEKRLDRFLKHIGLDSSSFYERANEFADKAKSDNSWATNNIIRYLWYQKERAESGEISFSTLPNYYKPIKLFCEQNDIQLNWKKITRGIPKGRAYAADRAPTLEEIRRLLNYPDRRIRAAVLVMASSGIRLGAWDYLKWGHVEPIHEEDSVAAAKITVYFGTPEQYISFITPEAYRALEEWIKLREQHGEKITEDSWVLRDLWDATSKAKRGLATVPKKLKSSGVKRLIERGLWAQGLRKPLEGKKRHEFQTDHGFRKFFKTRAENSMRPANVEILMGHSIGVSNSYYKPLEKELIEDYLKAIPDLTISETEELRKQNTEMQKQFTEIMRSLETRLDRIELERLKEKAETIGKTQ